MANASTLEKYTDLPEAPYNAERGALLVYLLKNLVEAALFEISDGMPSRIACKDFEQPQLRCSRKSFFSFTSQGCLVRSAQHLSTHIFGLGLLQVTLRRCSELFRDRLITAPVPFGVK